MPWSFLQCAKAFVLLLMCKCHFIPIVTGSIAAGLNWQEVFYGFIWGFQSWAYARLEAAVCIEILFSFSIVCKTTEISPGNSPFLCMDLTYITFLLQELGFPKSQVFKVMYKMDWWEGGQESAEAVAVMPVASSLICLLATTHALWLAVPSWGHCPHDGDYWLW